MNLAISGRLGMSLGNWQALLNCLLFIIVILWGREYIGFGTLANMFLVGYSIDFFSWVWSKVLPDGLFEAAKLDGAGEWTMLWKVAFPLSKPIMATFTLFYAVDRWNEWYNALLYINKKALSPLQIYLRDILTSLNSQLSTQAQQMMGSTQKVSTSAVQMATIVITALPIMLVYPYLQKYFVNGVMVGGIKE